MLLRALGRQDWVTVDMQERLTTQGLVQFFPSTTWPPTAAVGLVAFVSRQRWMARACMQVRQLATKVESFRKKRAAVPFIFVDLKKCAVTAWGVWPHGLWAWCVEVSATLLC